MPPASSLWPVDSLFIPTRRAAWLARAATRDGALDKKTKELIALALGVAAHCDGCIGFHTEALVGLGAAGAARRFANLASSEDWLALMNVIERADDPGVATLGHMRSSLSCKR